MSPTPPRIVDHDDPTPLLELLSHFPDSVVVGYEPDGDHVQLHVAPLLSDDRAAAAGLFGLHAEPSWSAAGVAVVGRARHLHTRQVVGDGANAAVVVTRSGAVASRFHVDGLDDALPAAPDGGGEGAEGLVVDALHRMLGLPVRGTQVPPAHLALTVWADRVLDVLLSEGSLDWADALRLHPGDPGPGPIGPSIEMLVEATVRFTDGFDWADLHRRTAQGRRAGYDLTPQEAAWMDVTMFSRWVAGSLPDLGHALHVIDLHGCHTVADRLRKVALAIGVVNVG